MKSGMDKTYKCFHCDGKGSISAGKGVYGLHYCDNCGGTGRIKPLITELSDESREALLRVFERLKDK